MTDNLPPLLPCPFCGGAGKIEDHRTIWAVRCSCGVCMLGERAPEPEKEMPDEYWDGYMQTAVDAWNARAAIEASRAAVPAGWVLVPKSLIDAFPEINPSNYDHDDACELNRWGCEVVTTAVASPQPVAQPGDPAKVRIHTAVASCRECPSARYETSGYYACEKLNRRFDAVGRPPEVPNWCPLPSHPGCHVAQAEPEQAAQQWQPIETAPKNGTKVLATWDYTWCQSGPHAEVCETNESGEWFYSYDGDGPQKPPTHWMPLPAPPKPKD